MSTLELESATRLGSDLRLEELGELTPIGRPGGQGRVYAPAHVPAAMSARHLARAAVTRGRWCGSRWPR